MSGLTIVVFVIGIIVFIVSDIWLLLIAFRESNSCGLLCMFLPLYSIYYGITRWTETKKPFLIGSVGIVALIGGLIPTIAQATGEVEPVMIEFMEAGAAKDVDRAYACCHYSINIEEVTELIEYRYDLFEGFQDITIGSFSVNTSAGITTAELSGAIIYYGDIKMPFDALLVKENDAWKITAFYIGY